MKPVVFTDLDGTLLDPVTYGFEEALPALRALKERGVPLVLVSSKTRGEIEAWRERLGNTHPFISENGGGVFMPTGYFPFAAPGRDADGYTVSALGLPYAEVRDALAGIRAGLGLGTEAVRGFGDMTAPEVGALTGLGAGDAALAMERDFDEPFVFKGGEAALARVLGEIEKRGYAWTRGRLYHIHGPGHDKGRAAAILKGHYARLYGSIFTIGLGDGQNDLPLLREVDAPVLVRKQDGSYEPAGDGMPGLARADGVGPAGWRRAVMDALKRFEQ